MTAPRTEAGRALLAVEHEPKGVCWAAPDCDCADAIVLIEAEATAAERARIRAAVEGLVCPHGDIDGDWWGTYERHGWEAALTAVAALLTEDPA